MKTKPFLKSMALVICCLTSFVLVSCDKDDDKPNLKISPNKVEVAVVQSGGYCLRVAE